MKQRQRYGNGEPKKMTCRLLFATASSSSLHFRAIRQVYRTAARRHAKSNSCSTQLLIASHSIFRRAFSFRARITTLEALRSQLLCLVETVNLKSKGRTNHQLPHFQSRSGCSRRKSNFLTICGMSFDISRVDMCRPKQVREPNPN